MNDNVVADIEHSEKHQSTDLHMSQVFERFKHSPLYVPNLYPLDAPEEHNTFYFSGDLRDLTSILIIYIPELVSPLLPPNGLSSTKCLPNSFEVWTKELFVFLSWCTRWSCLLCRRINAPCSKGKNHLRHYVQITGCVSWKYHVPDKRKQIVGNDSVSLPSNRKEWLQYLHTDLAGKLTDTYRLKVCIF